MADRRRCNVSRLPLSLAIGSLLASGPLHSAVITVDVAVDGPVGTTPGCSLRSAVASANAGILYDDCAPGSAYADQIVFDASLAYSTITLSEGEIEISNDLTITGPVESNPAGLVVDANNASRIFNLEGEKPSDFELGLYGLTLTGGRTTANDSPGGAVVAENADVRLNDSLLTGNSAELSGGVGGGGLLVRDGNLTLIDSTLSNNTAGGTFGVGAGAAVVRGDLILTGSTVSDNSTSGYVGYGGGLSLFSGQLTLTDSTVSGNSTTGEYARGGGMHVVSGGITLIRSTVSSNSTAEREAFGGGIYQSGSGGPLILINSTVSGNTTAGIGAYGGGIFSRSDVFLTHSTVADNRASSVDGKDGVSLPYFTDASITLNNSLIVQYGSDETACSDMAVTAVNSLATDTSCTGTATKYSDISLNPLADNGGPTLTHALAASSVARNGAGDCADEFEITTDQRGQQRPGLLSTACDIGAFEYQAADALFSDRFEAD